ncbi:MAG: hypothetical protein HC941_09400 [Microcoleus sp. SU_5_3]|nr:hypothetical protein [Microcoleus sp. SU_5_3]
MPFSYPKIIVACGAGCHHPFSDLTIIPNYRETALPCPDCSTSHAPTAVDNIISAQPELRSILTSEDRDRPLSSLLADRTYCINQQPGLTSVTSVTQSVAELPSAISFCRSPFIVQ